MHYYLKVQMQMAVLFAAGMFSVFFLFFLMISCKIGGELTSLVREKAALGAFGIHISPVG